MTAKTKALQGNLFNEPNSESVPIDSLQKSATIKSPDLNDEELKKDAEKRPRKKKNPQNWRFIVLGNALSQKKKIFHLFISLKGQ